MNSVGVLPQLREILREAREDAGSSFTQVASNLGKVENVIRRFEKGDSSPAFAEVDAMVEAYADVTGVAAMDLWNRALVRATAHEAEVVAEGEAADQEVGPRKAKPAARPRPQSKRRADS